MKPDDDIEENGCPYCGHEELEIDETGERYCPECGLSWGEVKDET